MQVRTLACAFIALAIASGLARVAVSRADDRQGDERTSNDRKVGEIKVGDKTYIHTADKTCVAFGVPDRKAYVAFLSAIRDRSLPDLHEVPARLLSPGLQVTVRETHDDPEFPLKVPAALVRVKASSGEDVECWLPLQNLRDDTAPMIPGEFRLPVFVVRQPHGYVPKMGETIALEHLGGELVIAFNFNSYLAYVRASVAGDERLIHSMIVDQKIRFAESQTKVKVLGIMLLAIDKRPMPLVQCRVVGEGQAFRDQVVWASAEDCFPIVEIPSNMKRFSGIGRGYDVRWEKPTPRETEQARMFSTARNLEKSERLAEARDAYREIVKKYPGTKEAAAAAERIMALEAKRNR